MATAVSGVGGVSQDQFLQLLIAQLQNQKLEIDDFLKIRSEAKAKKDWATSDEIRDELSKLGFEVKDTKDGANWKLNK